VSIAAGGRPRVELRLTTTGELLSGTVRDSGAGPLVGARVTTVEFPGRGRQLRFGTTSGAAGRYALRLPPGHWHVSASADGYAYAWIEVAIEGSTVSDLALSAAGAIAGRVIDAATGAPAAGAIVRLDRPGAPAGRTTSTSAAGFFSFGSTWPAGPYRLTASADERVARLEVPQSDPAARSPVELALRPGLAVAGRVADGRGRPLAGAAVQLFETPRQIQPVRQVTTDGDGRYRIAGLPAGAVWIGAGATGRAPQRRAVTPGPASPGTDFALASEATLTGVVTREDGRPAGGAELRLTLLSSAEASAPLLAFRRVPLDGQGGFRLEGLAAGAFVADVQTRGAGAGRFQGTLGPGERRAVTWRLSGPQAPDGRGRDAVVVGPF
jgi:5-hydroxyisourate hydrolase-like protein (transthyretin family)